MASCLENLKNLEMSGNLTDVRELSGKTVCANRTSGSTRWPKKTSRTYRMALYNRVKVKKVKFSHTRYRVLGPELIPVYRQSARR